MIEYDVGKRYWMPLLVDKFSFQAVVGLLSNSIAIVMDAVNNLSDAASSVITIVGTKLAGKQADNLTIFQCIVI